MYYTTLDRIREYGPCDTGWERLLKHLGKTKADDEPVSLLTILEFNGLDDALWALRAVDGIEAETRLYAVRCVRQIQHLIKDAAHLHLLDVTELYAVGMAAKKEVDAAWNATEETTWDVVVDTAQEAAWETVLKAVDGDAWATARAAAQARALAAALATALAAARTAQEAARAEWNSERDKVLAAKNVERDMVLAAWEAGRAAWKAARKVQEEDFRAIFCAPDQA